jgi:haloalkane dehalogenase
MATERPGGLAPDVRAGLLAPYDNWQHRVAVARFVQDIPLTRNHRTFAVLEQLESDLALLAHIPVQLIWGMRDWCFDAGCLQRFMELLPHCRVHRIAAAGHWVIEDAPQEIIGVMNDFLRIE